jgi:hypothetical protein
MACVYEVNKVSVSSSGKSGVCYGWVTDLQTMEALSLPQPHYLFTPLIGQCSLVQQLWWLCEYHSPGIEPKYKPLAAYAPVCKQVLCRCIPWVFEGGERERKKSIGAGITCPRILSRR